MSKAGRKSLLNEEQQEFILKWRHRVKVKHFAKLFNVNIHCVIRLLRKHCETGVRVPRKEPVLAYEQVVLMYYSKSDIPPTLKVSDIDRHYAGEKDVIQKTYIEDSYGKLPVDKIAKRLKNKPSAIYNMANKMGLSAFDASDDLLISEIEDRYGVSRYIIYEMAKEGLLEIRQLGRYKFVSIYALDNALKERKQKEFKTEKLENSDTTVETRIAKGRPREYKLRCADCGLRVLDNTIFCRADKCRHKEEILSKEIGFKLHGKC